VQVTSKKPSAPCPERDTPRRLTSLAGSVYIKAAGFSLACGAIAGPGETSNGGQKAGGSHKDRHNPPQNLAATPRIPLQSRPSDWRCKHRRARDLEPTGPRGSRSSNRRTGPTERHPKSSLAPRHAPRGTARSDSWQRSRRSPLPSWPPPPRTTLADQSGILGGLSTDRRFQSDDPDLQGN